MFFQEVRRRQRELLTKDTTIKAGFWKITSNSEKADYEVDDLSDSFEINVPC